jgi:hypothetical protein
MAQAFLIGFISAGFIGYWIGKSRNRPSRRFLP